MGHKIAISSAGNTLAPALATLCQLGYSVSQVSGSPQLLQAESSSARLRAEDPLLLLGLACLVQHRGADWQPTDSEVAQLLALIESHGT